MYRLLTRPMIAPRAPSKSASSVKPINLTHSIKSLPTASISVRFFSTKQLYVGNLPWTTSETELRDLFSEFGKVHEVKIINDRQTGRAKGFAFVTLDAGAGATAVSSLDGKAFGGRTLRVNEAQPQQNRPPRDGGDMGGGFRSRGPRRDSGEDQ